MSTTERHPHRNSFLASLLKFMVLLSSQSSSSGEKISFSSNQAAPSREMMPPKYKNGTTKQVTFIKPKRVFSGFAKTAPLLVQVEECLIIEDP